MRESDFNTEVVNSIKELGGWAFKVPDHIPAMGSRFTPDKPCDIIGGYRGKFIGIESKQMKEFKAIGIRDIRYSQEKALDEMVDKGNRAFLFVNIRTERGRNNRLIPFDWKEWRSLLKNESIKQKALMEMPFIKGHKGRFDLTEILKSL